MSSVPRAWEFQAELDTAESWPYFRAFRDAKGSRDLKRVSLSVWDRGARAGVPPLDRMREWYVRGRWAERAVLWDAHLDEIANEEAEIRARETGADVAKRHRELFALLHAVVRPELVKLAGEAADESRPALKPRELVSAMDSLVKAERLHHGEATERVAGLSALTDEELERIHKMLTKEDETL